jgi:hypothetical protein
LRLLSWPNHMLTRRGLVQGRCAALRYFRDLHLIPFIHVLEFSYHAPSCSWLWSDWANSCCSWLWSEWENSCCRWLWSDWAILCCSWLWSDIVNSCCSWIWSDWANSCVAVTLEFLSELLMLQLTPSLGSDLANSHEPLVTPSMDPTSQWICSVCHILFLVASFIPVDGSSPFESWKGWHWKLWAYFVSVAMNCMEEPFLF